MADLDPDLDAPPLALAHPAVEAHEHFVGVRAGIDLASDLGHPQLDIMVSEHREGEAELAAVEGAGRFADDHGLEAPVGSLEGVEERQRLRSALPRQRSGLADVEVLGDDHPTLGEDGLARDICHCFEDVGSCWSSVLTRP